MTMWLYSQTSELDICDVQNAVCHVQSEFLTGTTEFEVKTITQLLMTAKQFEFVFCRASRFTI